MAGVEVKFASRFAHRLSALETKIFPKGWAGTVEHEIAAAAEKAGALVRQGLDQAAGKAPTDPADGTVAQIKAWLDEQGVAIPAAAKKPELVGLVHTQQAKLAAIADLPTDQAALLTWLHEHGATDVDPEAPGAELAAQARQLILDGQEKAQ